MGHFLFQSIFYLSIIFKKACQFSFNFYNCKKFKRSGHQWPSVVTGETVAVKVQSSRVWIFLLLREKYFLSIIDTYRYIIGNIFSWLLSLKTSASIV